MAAVNMELAGQVAAAEGLRHEDKALVRELMDTWRTHRSRNMVREDYYLGHVGVGMIEYGNHAGLTDGLQNLHFIEASHNF